VSFHLNHRWFASQYSVFSEVSLVVTIRTYVARLPAKGSSSFGGVQIYDHPIKESFVTYSIIGTGNVGMHR